MIDDTPYATLEEAFAAVADGQTIELLGNVELTEAQTLNLNNLEGTGITLDLGKFTLTTTAALTIANTKMTIANGEITVPTASGLVFKTNSDVTLAVDGVIRPTETYAFEVEDATFNVYGKCTANVQVPIHAKVDGGVINIYDGAVVENTDPNFDAIRINGGETEDCTVTLNVYGGTITGAYSIYAYKPNNKSIINIEGGVFNNILVIRRDSQVQVTPLDDTCTAKFKVIGKHESMDNLLVSELCAEGFAPKQIASGDYAGYYQIAAQYKVLFKVDDAKVTTNLVWAGDTTTAAPAPTVEGYIFKGWKCDEQVVAAGAEITPVADMTFVAVLEEDAKPVDPEEPSEAYETPEQAADAAKKINDNKEKMINTPTDSGATPARYTSLFTAVVKPGNIVEVELNEDGTNAVKAAANTIETAVAAKLADIAAAATTETEVEIPKITEGVEPGFWYGLAATADLTQMKATTPAEWKQATTEGVSGLKAKKPSADKGFFQIKVSVKGPAAE